MNSSPKLCHESSATSTGSIINSNKAWTCPVSKQFANEKKQTLGKLDKSVKGQIDAPIVEMMEMINSCDHFFTTSSCSGRIIVTSSCLAEYSQSLSSTSAVTKKGLHWQFVSHEPISDVDMFIDRILVQARSSGEYQQNREMILKFEPVIAHIRACDIEAARRLLQVGLQSGLRNSGIVLSSNGRAIVALRSTASLQVPLVIDGELVVDANYLRQVVKLANRKMATNRQLIERLQRNLERFFSSF